MADLDSAQRRALRAQAHHLHPVVTIGSHGLTTAVLHEIDVNLLAHGLIKLRVFSDDRAERETLLQRICADLDAAPIQHLGKVLVIYRERPDEEPEQVPAAKSARRPVAHASHVSAPDRRRGAAQGARPRAGGPVAASRGASSAQRRTSAKTTGPEAPAPDEKRRGAARSPSPAPKRPPQPRRRRG